MMSKRAPKIDIRCTQWGNWYGYVGGKKVKCFFATPERSQFEAAQAWLTEQHAEQRRYSWNRTER